MWTVDSSREVPPAHLLPLLLLRLLLMLWMTGINYLLSWQQVAACFYAFVKW